MLFKTDTKEKFHVITVQESHLSATMTDELEKSLLSFLEKNLKNVVLNLKDIQTIDDAAAEKIVHIQQKFYQNNVSFVVCEMQNAVKENFERSGLLERMNVTPTESEAWDIVQMEEIEREFLDDEES
jgi:anti-anti-sigma factor